MISNESSSDIYLTPKFGPCNDVKIDTYPDKKTIWLVPHIIQNRSDAIIIIWRCNWGSVCKSSCVYGKMKEQKSHILQEYPHNLPKYLFPGPKEIPGG